MFYFIRTWEAFAPDFDLGSKKVPPTADVTKTTVSFQEEEHVTTQAKADETTTAEPSTTTATESSTSLAESNDQEPAVATKVEMAKDKEGVKTTQRKRECMEWSELDSNMCWDFDRISF